MRAGVSSYSYLSAVRAGRLTQIEAIDLAAKQGYDAIEFAVLYLTEGQTALEFAKLAKQRAKDAGIEISAYCVGADFLKNPVADMVSQLRGELEVAAELGAPVMRHDASGGFPPEFKGPRSFAAALPRLADGCGQVADIANGMGITTCIENHGRFCQDSLRVEALCCAVDRPNFGLLVDVGNFMCADEKPEVAVGVAAQYAVHAHVKDFFYKDGQAPDPGQGWFPTRAGHKLRGAILGHGVVPVVQCLKLLKNSGYNGMVSVEFEGMEDPERACQIAHDNLRAYIALAEK